MAYDVLFAFGVIIFSGAYGRLLLDMVYWTCCRKLLELSMPNFILQLRDASDCYERGVIEEFWCFDQRRLQEFGAWTDATAEKSETLIGLDSMIDPIEFC